MTLAFQGYAIATTAASPSAATSVSGRRDRKSTRLNSSHSQISYAVFCLKKKKELTHHRHLSHAAGHHPLLPRRVRPHPTAVLNGRLSRRPTVMRDERLPVDAVEPLHRV